jgi:protoheme IX farnesyltransferase
MANTLVMKSSDNTLNAFEKLRAVYELGKPRVVMLIMFTALVGMIMAEPMPLADIPWLKVFWATLGIGLVSSAGAAINHIVDQKADAEMSRTHNRPLPTGRISNQLAIFAAVAELVVGEAILLWQTNVLTAVLTFFAMVGYAFIYTLFLKRNTPQNIVWGGAAGAVPPLLGWVAMTGQVSIESIVLFAIIFFWTPPHFWPLAIYRVEEYRKIGMPMLPVTHGIEHTKKQIVLYTVLMFIATLAPYFVGMSGTAYLLSAVALNALFGFYVYRLYVSPDNQGAMRLFAYSIVYLMLIFVFLLADHFLYLPVQ